jgi:hypothetical protein
MVNQYQQIKRPAKLSWVSIKSDSSLTLANTGDGSILVEQLMLSIPSLGIRSVQDLDLKGDDQSNSAAVISKDSAVLISLHSPDNPSYPSAYSKEEWEELTRERDVPPLFQPVFYNGESPHLESLRGASPPPAELSAKGCVYFFSTRAKKRDNYCMDLIAVPFKVPPEIPSKDPRGAPTPAPPETPP